VAGIAAEARRSEVTPRRHRPAWPDGPVHRGFSALSPTAAATGCPRLRRAC